MADKSHCAKCGCELDSGYDYCPNCGDVMMTHKEKILFESLRKLRLRLAKAVDLPPYMIFHDKTLKEIAKRRPKTAKELLAVPGVGKAKAAKYGSFIIEEVRIYDFL